MKTAPTFSPDDEADRYEGVPHPRYASLIIGHLDHQKSLLRAYRANRLPHAIIFAGLPGIGKATLGWGLAKVLLSTSASGAAAGDRLLWDDEGPAVAQAEALTHPDLVLLRRESNEKAKRFFTEIRADDVRRTIGMFQRAAGAGGYRICIVDSADDLNRSSANALLKLIEEPPPRSLFLLVSHRPGLILPTIRSRARMVRLGSLDAAEIGAVVRSLGEPWSILPTARIDAAASAAQGSVHDALRRLEPRATDLEDGIGRMLERLPQVDWREVHRLADQMAGRDGEASFATFLTTLYDWLAYRVRSRAGERPHRLAPYAEVWEKIAAAARETDALNLDKRPLILSIFSDLAAAVRASSA